MVLLLSLLPAVVVLCTLMRSAAAVRRGVSAHCVERFPMLLMYSGHNSFMVIRMRQTHEQAASLSVPFRSALATRETQLTQLAAQAQLWEQHLQHIIVATSALGSQRQVFGTANVRFEATTRAVASSGRSRSRVPRSCSMGMMARAKGSLILCLCRVVAQHLTTEIQILSFFKAKTPSKLPFSFQMGRWRGRS